MYTITIEKTIEVKKTAGQEWKQVGEENGKPVYGYTPEIVKTGTQSDVIYMQKVEEFDLQAVIEAVNKGGQPLFFCDKHGLHRETMCPVCLMDALK